MRIIVAAAGSQEKWDHHLGVRSHFAPVRIEPGSPLRMPLLERTLLQARSRCSDVWLTVPPEAPGPYRDLAAAHGVSVHTAAWGCRNEYESSRPVWAGRGRGATVLLLGDVYYSEQALDTVTADPGAGIRFFGRQGASEVTGTPWGEIFANSWPSQLDDEMSRLTDQVRRLQNNGGADPDKHGWTILRLLQGTPLMHHIVQAPWWVEIDDLTDDLDYPEDYDRHPATRQEPADVR